MDPVGELAHVGLPQQHRASLVAQALPYHGVFGRDPVAVDERSGRRRDPGRIDVVLDGYRQARQRTVRSEGLGRSEELGGISPQERVQVAVARNAMQVLLECLTRRQLSASQAGDELDRREVVEPQASTSITRPSRAERRMASEICTLRRPSRPDGSGSRPSSIAREKAATVRSYASCDE